MVGENVTGYRSGISYTGNKLEGEEGDTVSLQAQTSPYFQLREKFKCTEHKYKSEIQLKTSP